MAELGRLWHSHYPHDGTVEQVRAEEAHPNPMLVVTVNPLEPPPAYHVVIGWSMVGFKSSASNVTAELHLDATG